MSDEVVNKKLEEIKEGILYHKGTEGLLEMAKRNYKEHPSLYLAALLEWEKSMITKA